MLFLPSMDAQRRRSSPSRSALLRVHSFLRVPAPAVSSSVSCVVAPPTTNYTQCICPCMRPPAGEGRGRASIELCRSALLPYPRPFHRSDGRFIDEHLRGAVG